MADTKLDLAIEPGAFLLRALHLWDASGAFGQVQNQAYGYLFPLGPFFWLGSLMHIPPWAVQRLWWALVLVVAFLGVVKLLGVLRVGAPWARIVAGLAFSLSPRMLSVLGPSSIEVWPSALAPWVLVPLVIATQRGDPRRGAALSAVAVALVGGVNAVATFAVIPLAAWWIATSPRGPRRRSLMIWWPPLVLMGTAWWLLPLFLLGKYSPPFLDYIESISNTSFAATTVDALRGTTNWVPYVDGGSSAGQLLISEPVLIANGAVLLAFGLYGLARADLPWRGFVIPSVFAGLMIVTVGHVGATSGWGVETLRALLDGTLSPLRNAHKFDVLIRLPLTIGLCHGLTVLTVRRSVASAGVVTLLVAALVGASSPAWTARLAPSGSFNEIPGYWGEAADWLESNADGRTLLTPASPFGRYVWGKPRDEPLQPLLRSPWAVRNVIPLTPGANIDMLDALSRQLATGRGTPELAAHLRSVGVGTVLLRHDLDRSSMGVDSPETVRSTLVSTPGVQLVATFGPEIGGGASLESDDGRITFIDGGRQTLRPALEVFSLAGAQDGVRLQTEGRTATVVGDADTLIRLRSLDRLSAQQSAVFGPDVTGVPRGPVTLSDGNRRQEVAFAEVRRNRSASLSTAEPYRADRAVHRYDEQRLQPWSTVPRLIGAESLTASSSRADVGARPVLDPSSHPWAAFDDDLRTAWRPDEAQARRAWIDLDLGRVVDVGDATITLDLPRDQARQLRVSTEGGPVTLTAQGGRPVAVAVGSVERVRVEALRTPARELAIAQITLEQVDLARSLVMPNLPSGWPSPTDVLMQTQGGRNDGCLAVNGVRRCSDAFVERTEDGRSLDRTFSLPVGASYRPAMRVSADAGRDLDALMQRGRVATIDVSSQQSASALGGALAAVDGSLRTGWTAAADDVDPTISLRWLTPERVDSIRLVTPSTMAASQPRRRATGVRRRSAG